MRFLKRNTPDVPLEVVRRALRADFALEGRLTPLDSERDQNFRVETDRGDFLFKVCNEDEPESSIDFQIDALKHIERVDDSVPVPRALPTVTGASRATVGLPNGQPHVTRLLSWLEGVSSDASGYDTRAFRENTGRTLAVLDRALGSFFHPAARGDHPWDLSRVPRLLDYVQYITDDRVRRQVTSVIERSRDHTLPRCARLRHQVIHQDAHMSNLVVDPTRPAEVAGIIDFGDMVYGPLIAELAVAAYLSERPDPSPDAILDVVVGYDDVHPLEEAEVDVLYDLALARMAMGAVITATRAALWPDDSAYGPDIAFLGQRIDAAVEAAPEVEGEIRRNLRFPSRKGAVPTAALREARESSLGKNSPHFYREPLHVVAARGMWVYGEDGKPYLDFYNNVPVVGHGHPHVINAISRQLSTLNINTRYLNSTVVEYSQKLTSTLGLDLDATLFVNSGSEANDVASQIVKRLTGREGLLVMKGSYHGMTEATLAITNEDDATLGSNVALIGVPDTYRADPPTEAETAGDVERAISELALRGYEPAGVFIDPGLTSNGIPDLPSGFVKTVSGVVRNHGGLVVSDEVQVGLGRMGVMWGHQLRDFTPDIVTMGKPVGNGQPLGVVATRLDLLDQFLDATALFSTFGGNPVSCAAGLAVLDVIERENLVEHAARTGHYLERSLNDLTASQPLIGDVRGSGLLIGLELVADRNSKAPAPAETALLIERMRDAGVLVGAAGRRRNVLKLRPPLITDTEDVDFLISALVSSLERVR
ncbi:MAG: aminotransferase class III-fold pyridoxal phosphate-dependent enzyme [Acidimicrobiia bacterium]